MARQIIDLPEMNDESLAAGDLFVIRDVDNKKDKKLSLMSLVDFFYPVGQIWTNDLVDPNTRFPGTIWEKIEARFVIGSGVALGEDGVQRIFNVGDEGGEYAHKLTTTEMPRHKHGMSGSMNGANAINDRGGDNVFISDANGDTEKLNNWQPTSETKGVNYSGGDGYHNNMPPFRASHVWVRTA